MKFDWICPMCDCVLPLDNGAADDFGDVCDECAEPLAALRDRFPQAPLSLTPRQREFRHEKLVDHWTFDDNEDFDATPDALDRYVENLVTELELAAQGEQ